MLWTTHAYVCVGTLLTLEAHLVVTFGIGGCPRTHVHAWPLTIQISLSLLRLLPGHAHACMTMYVGKIGHVFRVRASELSRDVF